MFFQQWGGFTSRSATSTNMAVFSISFKTASDFFIFLSSTFGIAAVGNATIYAFDAYVYPAHEKLETTNVENRGGSYLAIGF